MLGRGEGGLLDEKGQVSEPKQLLRGREQRVVGRHPLGGHLLDNVHPLPLFQDLGNLRGIKERCGAGARVCTIGSS